MEVLLADRGDLVFARRGNWGYGDISVLDAGQMFALGGFRNDEKLVRLGYVEPAGKAKGFECNRCGSKFIDEHSRDMHGRKRHDRPAPANAQEAEA